MLSCKARKMSLSNNKSGYVAEFLARCLLRLKGYRILAKNYVTGRGTNAGELDIVALKGNTVIFIEVKKRRDLEEAAYAISENQKQRISRGAEAFLKHYLKYQNNDIRFDAILVKLPLEIRHIKNAW